MKRPYLIQAQRENVRLNTMLGQFYILDTTFELLKRNIKRKIDDLYISILCLLIWMFDE